MLVCLFVLMIFLSIIDFEYYKKLLELLLLPITISMFMPFLARKDIKNEINEYKDKLNELKEIKEHFKLNFLSNKFTKTHYLYRSIVDNDNNENYIDINEIKNKYNLLYSLVNEVMNIDDELYYLDENVINLVKKFHDDCELHKEKILESKKNEIKNKSSNFEEIYGFIKML